MCRKRFPIATVVRHSIPTLPQNYHSFPAGIIENQIAVWKGFSAYMPVINSFFPVNLEKAMTKAGWNKKIRAQV
jgi:hypothetical protein